MREGLHSLLRRQLKRCYGEAGPPPEVNGLVQAVNAAYHEFDADRGMLERSLELSSHELLQANAEMRAIFQAIPDLLFRIDDQGTILSYKAGTTVDLLRPPAELVGRRIQDVPIPEIGPRLARALRRVNETRKLVSLEYQMTSGAGPQSYEARFVPEPNGQIVVIIRNITERSRSEELRQGQNAVLEMIASGAALSDVATRLARMVETQSSDTDCAVLLLTADRQSLTCCAAPSVPPEFVRLLQSVPVMEGAGSAGTAAFRNETVIVPDLRDNPIWERWGAAAPAYGVRSCWSVPIRSRQGGVLGTLAFFHRQARVPTDAEVQVAEVATRLAGVAIERRQLADQLLQSQKMEAFGKLAGGVAHDFNNLLTVIMGNLALLDMEDLSDAERQVALEEVSAATERARQLTRQLLTFSRRQPVRMQAVNLNEVVAGMTRMLQRLIGEHIQLETNCAPDVATVWADRGMLEQAIMNLAVNARDAMPKGGRLHLQTEAMEISAAQAAVHQEACAGPGVRLRVSDTGCGIAPEHLPHLFEPFFSTKEVGRGTGLGLATVYGIVEQHRGWIEVESRLAQGTTFTLHLPCCNANLSARPEPPARRPQPGGHETILLVEDEMPVRTLLGNLLERHGYRVLAAASGPEALSLWQQQRDAVQLLITDMVMPGGMNGRELAERLRADAPALRTIYCSGYTNEMAQQDTWVQEGDAFLEKPIDLPTILRLVRTALDRK